MKKLRILVTNDDGIDSPGLAVVVRWAQTLGDVYVAAPTVQQSGKSHALTLHVPFDVTKVQLGLGEKAAYAVASTPVDCVRFATIGLGLKFDLVFSGVNHGYNVGEDILYSGTVGAVFESGLRGICGIALSTVTDTWQYAQQALPDVWKFVTEHKLVHGKSILNVNIPPQYKGILLTRQGGPYFDDKWIDLGTGQWQQNGYCVHNNVHNHELDTDATIDGYITVTPLTTDRTAH